MTILGVSIILVANPSLKNGRGFVGVYARLNLPHRYSKEIKNYLYFIKEHDSEFVISYENIPFVVNIMLEANFLPFYMTNL